MSATMRRELPPHDPFFSYDEQYGAAAWHATFESLALLHQDPDINNPELGVPRSAKLLAEIAFKNIDDLVPTIAIATQKDNKNKPLYNDFLQYGLFDIHTHKIDSQIEWMTALYSTETPIFKEFTKEYHMDRFEDDVDLLARFGLKRYKDHLQRNPRDKLSIVRTIQHDNDLYIGMWDRDRLLGG